MSTAQTVFLIVVGVLILLALGNWAFSVVAERRNPPIGTFTECEGVRLHYLDRGDPTAPCVVLLHGNGSMIKISRSAGLLTVLPAATVLCALTGQASGIATGPARVSGPQRLKRLCL